MLSRTQLITELLFIDASVEDYGSLLQNIKPGVEVYPLTGLQDGMRQITEVLFSHVNRGTSVNVYIVAHGSPGTLTLGNSELSLSTLERYSNDLQTWFTAPVSFNQLFLYACNVGAGDAGAEFLAKLHHLTGATIHASTTKIGNVALGGNWELDAIASNHALQTLATHNIPFSSTAMVDYAGVLMADTDGDGVDDSIDLDDDNDGIPDLVEGPAPTDSGHDGSYTAAEVTVNTAAASTVLESIQINGLTFSDLTTPDSYTASFAAPDDPDDIYVINNGTEEADFASATNWETDAIAPFASRDLNYYQSIDTNVSGADYFELGYSTPVVTTAGMFIAFTERNSNNAVTLEAFDASGNSFNRLVNVGSGDYVPTGVNVDYRGGAQALGIAIYALDDLAPVGAAIAKIRVTPETNPRDAADGKVFIFGDDTLQTSQDTDGDGIPNRLDLDSDNDGISDLVESGQNPALIDINNDGIRDDIANTTNDADGLADAVSGLSFVDPINSDNDTIPDYLDLDADNDGIPDVVEGLPTIGYTTNGIVTNSDSDGDGVIDAFDTPGNTFGGAFARPENTDQLGQPDYLDTDSDDDGLLDSAESGLNLTGPFTDTNGDGIDDRVNASYADPDGDINVPLTNLKNSDLDLNDADYRSLNLAAPLAPTAVDDSTTVPAGTPVTINPLANDTDDGTLVPSTVMFTTPPAGSTLSADGKTLTVPGEGTWSINPTTGTISFTPVNGFTGDPTPIQYTVEDNDGVLSNPATVSINYVAAGTPIPPTAEDDVITAPQGTQAMIDPLTNDGDVDGSLDPTTVVFVNTPTGGTLSANGKTLDVPGEGTWSINPTTGAISFTPLPTFIGTPTPVEYTVNDDEGLTSDAAKIRLTYFVPGQPIPPTASDDELVVSDAGQGIIDPLQNDVDVDSSLDPTTVVFLNTNTPTGTSLSADGKTLIVPGEGTWEIDPATGVVTFTPNAGFEGIPTPVQYTVDDTDGLTSNAATITMNISIVGGDRIERTLKSLSDPDAVNGSQQDDIINGGSQQDVIRGKGGDDIINGGTNDDSIFGGAGSDLVNGGSGNDLIKGNADNDMLNGGEGNDRIFGGNGKDSLTGGDGNDKLYGQQKKDTIDAGAGNDLIVGGRGRDVLTGGLGRDRFRYLSTREFQDTITDFEILKDKFDLKKIKTIGSMDNLNIIQKGDDAIVQGWTGQRFKTIATLEHVDANDLTQSNFRF